MELKEVEINGVKVFKCFGHGQCSCKRCEETKGWNTHWTDWCYQYKGHIYCDKCIKEVLEDEK